MRVVEGADGERDQRRVRGRRRADAQPAALELRQRLELALRGGEAVEDGVGVAHEKLAGLREAHAARGALDEARAGLGLERRNLARDRGLGEGEHVGRGGEGAVRGDLAQDPEAADVEHDQNVYQMSAKIICVYTWPGARCWPCIPTPHSPAPSWASSTGSAPASPALPPAPSACPACASPGPAGRPARRTRAAERFARRAKRAPVISDRRAMAAGGRAR